MTKPVRYSSFLLSAILASYLILGCVNQKDKELAASQLCAFPSREIAQSQPVDTLFCDFRYDNEFYITALYYAIDQNDMDWVEEEIQRGANVNFHNNLNGNSALMRAIFLPNIEIVRLLLEHGADSNQARSDNGKNEASNGATPLVLAAGRGNTEIVKLLLEHGADPNKPRSDNGLTEASDGAPPLTGAAQRGYVEIVKLLLEHGADPDLTRSDNGKIGPADGSTPLIIAADKGHYQVAQLLLEHGAAPDKGSSDNAKTRASDGSTPLFAAVAHGHADVVKLLLDAGANPDKGRSKNGKLRSTDGATPLMYAAGRKPNVEIAKMLLEAGANLEIKNNSAATAYDYAKQYGTPETVKLLEEYMSKEEQTKGKLRDVLEVL